MTTPKQMLELADELERAHTLYLNQFGISPNHEIKRGKLAQLLWDDKQTFIEVLRLAAQADAPAILPQRMQETLESARDYIASVNFYAAGTAAYIKNCEQLIKIDVALAHTRPDDPPQQMSEPVIPLADHNEIGRMVSSQPWDVQKEIITITAHCTCLTDVHPTGPVADLAGCISQCCKELAVALTRPELCPAEKTDGSQS